jgi:Cu-Zn family superoxide dismutase
MKAPFAKTATLALMVPALLLGCGPRNPPPTSPADAPTTAPAIAPPATATPAPAADDSKAARAVLAPATGSNEQGTLTLQQGNGAVMISGEITGLTASTEHGFHVHETGVCTLPDFKSAGEHFNPGNAKHGGPQASGQHLGDMPNIKADAQGRAIVEVTINGATLKDGGKNDLLGKALVVHAMPDDYVTQPSGGSGARIACGVIQ